MLKSGSKREKKPNPHPASVAAREDPADLVSEADLADLAAGEVVAAAHQASVDLGSVAPAAQVVAAQVAPVAPVARVDLVALVDRVVRESPASPVSASQPPMCKASKTKTSTIAV
jgi:hypothetical protein